MGRLDGKVALITGGASGIGAAMVRRFVAEGATVVATDVEEDAGAQVAREAGAEFVPLDVRSEAGWNAVVDGVVARHGRLEALCNNAGITAGKPIDETTLEVWDQIIGVNLTGSMLGCRAAIRAMRELPAGRSGSIVNVSSTVALLGLAHDAAYTASKSGVVGLTRSVAGWCAQQRLPIRCNTLHPGTTVTAILQRAMDAEPAMKAVFEKMSPTGRMADPEEIANVAVFLASDESSYCTGASFVADGGLTATHPSL